MASSNPLARAIESGLKANDRIGDLFARVGTSSTPGGYVQSAYRNALRAMKTALKEENRLLAASDVLSNLRRSIETETRALFIQASAGGVSEAVRQLSIYGVQADPVAAPIDQTLVPAVVARLDSQEALIRALIQTGAEDEQIVGSEDRPGALRPSDVAGTAAIFAASLFWLAFENFINRPRPGQPQFSKQVVAALDARTTDCCLRAHGQIQPFAGKFELAGTPRFADRMEWSPFHAYCRTSIVLYLPEYDDGLTVAMRDGADRFLADRAAGRNPDRHPADAFG